MHLESLQFSDLLLILGQYGRCRCENAESTSQLKATPLSVTDFDIEGCMWFARRPLYKGQKLCPNVSVIHGFSKAVYIHVYMCGLLYM